MSRTDNEGAATELADGGPIDRVVEPRTRDIGAFNVHRLLPAVGTRMVGPFVFLDHMGPAVLPAGQGMDVRPHPHIGLATVTYLLEGEIVHRDSLGYEQTIKPGAINWMTAGRGIVHSERSGAETRASGQNVHGIQLWVGLPDEHEETDPSFHHHPAVTLPVGRDRGAVLHVLAGTAYGMTSPVRTFSPLFYADVALDAGASIPVPSDASERAALVLQGEASVGGHALPVGSLVVFRAGEAATITASAPTRLVVLGGEPIGPRFIWWNLVSSSRDRIEQAKSDWAQDRFPHVVGDELERIPLPEM